MGWRSATVLEMLGAVLAVFLLLTFFLAVAGIVFTLMLGWQ